MLEEEAHELQPSSQRKARGGPLDASGLDDWGVTRPLGRWNKRPGNIPTRAVAARIQQLQAFPLSASRQENGGWPVIGDSSPDADIAFVGEAPRAAEAETDRLFVGRTAGARTCLHPSTSSAMTSPSPTSCRPFRGDPDRRVGESELHKVLLHTYCYMRSSTSSSEP